MLAAALLSALAAALGPQARLEISKGTIAARTRSRSMMDGSQRHDDRWNWLLIGTIVSVVVVALYGPLVWELTRGPAASDLAASQTIATSPSWQRASLQF